MRNGDPANISPDLHQLATAVSQVRGQEYNQQQLEQLGRLKEKIANSQPKSRPKATGIDAKDKGTGQ